MPSRAPVFRSASTLDRPARQQRYDEARGSAVQRGYDQAWRRCRDAFIARHPICAPCWRRGRITKATEIHHKVAIVQDPGKRLEWDNLLSVCHPCHMAIEAKGGGDPMG